MLGHLDLGAAELAMLVRLHLAAELVAHRLLAVADAEHRQLGLQTTSGACGPPSACTECGEPERMMPLGLKPRCAWGRR